MILIRSRIFLLIGALSSGCCTLGQVEIANKRLSNQNGQNEGYFRIELDWGCIWRNFTPGNRLVGPGPRVTPIKFRRRVHKDRIVGPVSHQIGIANVVLNDAAAQNNHATALGLEGAIVQQADVLHEVHDEARLTPRVEVDNVAQRAVSEGRTEDGDLVLPAPVVNALLIVDFFAHPSDYFRGREDDPLFFLLAVQLLHQRQKPGLEKAIVLIWHDQVTDTIEALLAKHRAFEAKVSNVARSQALHDIFLDTPCRGHDLVNHFVLAEVAYVLAHATRCHVGGVAQVNGAPCVFALFGVAVLLFFILSDWLV